MADEYKHKDLTDVVINAFYQVYNTLGYGFLEKVYRNALAFELDLRGYQVDREVALKVYYAGAVVGEYYADIIINGSVILELKAVDTIAPEHEAQLLNYLKASDLEVGLILNFGPKPQVRRKVFDNARKQPKPHKSA